jgi:hypothetical protein
MENYWRSVDHARIYLKVSVQFCEGTSDANTPREQRTTVAFGRD